MYTIGRLLKMDSKKILCNSTQKHFGTRNFLAFAYTIIGYFVALLCGIIFSIYMRQLHETKLWFTNIKQVEQEISLRTEAGLYYSYYKAAVNLNASLWSTIQELTHDISTEYPREINVLQRFNIYQEIFLAALYKLLNHLKMVTALTPMLFYVYSCFAFSGFGISMLFLFAWNFSKSWIYALLVCTWMSVNLDDSTRVFFAVNLRENFALPFFWLQTICASSILGKNQGISIRYSVLYLITSILFSLFWQFNQFILFLQSISLTGVALLLPENESHIISILIIQLFASFVVIIAQFGQLMIVTSIGTAFNISAIILFYSMKKYQRNTLAIVSLKLVILLLLTGSISFGLRYMMNAKADTHIWTFVLSKAGLIANKSLPFETLLYICHGAFASLDKGFYQRTISNGCLPLYIIGILAVLTVFAHLFLVKNYGFTERKWLVVDIIGPEILFPALQSVLCGIIAIQTLRFKYLWYPQMAIIACVSLMLISKYVGRYITQTAVLAVVAGLLFRYYPIYQTEMANEQEFYDPDTVELMEWIKRETEPKSSWSGSMQLMAGVKACTNRYLANHPHFEDKWLRDRTLRLYQVYSRKSLNEVYQILVNEKVDYIILEDSICLAPSNGCSTNDIVDNANSEPIDSEVTKKEQVKPRFCRRIRQQDVVTKNFFELVFVNRTFRVYKVLKSNKRTV